MGVNKSVFGSHSERKNFQKLESRWGDKYDLWHNLPFLHIFTREPLIDPDSFDLRFLTISDIEWQKLKKTSVDYVLCDREHAKPLVCIDFDGLQDGFNSGREYLAGVEEPSPWRNQITSLKLKVAHGSLFPYFVVGSRHFADISSNVRFCIVDGIIGDVLAKNATSARFARGFTAADAGMSEEKWDALLPWDQLEEIQNFALEVEVGMDFEHNPVYSEVSKLEMELECGCSSWRFVDPPGSEQQIHGGKRFELPAFGVESTVETKDVGTIARTAWMPNFRAPGFIGIQLVENIACLMALDEVRNQRAKFGRQAERPTRV